MAGITICLISDAAIPRVKSAGQPVTMLNLDVNDLGDAADANVGDGICQTAGGVCTLRAAIEEAVSTAGSHSISISVSGVINLGGPLPNIDNSNGLTLLQISGTGSKNLTVRRDLGGNYQILFIKPIFPGAMAVSINGITISNGNSNVSGGGVYSLYSDLTLTGVAFTGNTSQNGSALYAGGAEVVITNCTFNGNSGSGATVAFDTLTPTTFRLENSTITGNTGGGVRLGLGSGANGAIISSTISSNTGNGVGLSGNGGRTVSLLSNIIAGNGGASLVLSGTNSYVSQGYNLASDGGGGYLTGTGDLLSTDPLLGVLGDYGGATSTQALLRGSPAIGAGSSTGTPATDQRGVARVGLSDIGAFESRGFQLVIAGGDNQVALTGATFANPLSVTITAGDSGVPVTGGPVTFSAPGTGASATIAGSPAVVTGGMATTGTLVANGIGGAYSVTATTSGVATPVSFGLRNNAAPKVISIVRAGASPTSAGSIGYTVTFNESVTGVTAGSFGLALTGAAGAAITGVAGSGTTWTVTVDTGGGTGQIGLNLVTGSGVIDSDGTPIANAPFTGEVYVLSPRVVSIARAGVNPTSAGSLGYTVTFSESVTGVSAANFALVASVAGGAAITGVSGSGSVWTVTVNSGTVKGTIGLDMTGSGGVLDSDGAAVGNLPFAGEVYAIAPKVVSIVRTGTSPTSAASIGYTVTFNESVTGLSGANFTLAQTGTGGAAITGVSGSGTTWTVTVDPGTVSGTIGLNMTGSGGVVDSDGAAVGNLPFAGEVYTIAPRVVSIVRTGANPTIAASLGYTVTFSESVTGVSAGSFGLALTGAGGATITGVAGSGSVWTVTVNPGTVSGTIGLNMTGSGGVVDSDGAAVGNLPFAGEVYTIAPRVVSIVRTGASPTSAGSIGYTVTFSESLIGGSAANFALVVTGTVSGTIQSVTGGGTTRTVTVIPGNGVGTIGLNMVNSTGIASGGGIAIAGLPQSGQLYDIDRVPPETAISSGPAATSTSSTATFVFSGNDGGAGSGVASYECRLDSGVYSACVSPKVYTGLGIGRHRFLVRAIDGVGNSDPDPATIEWVINNQPTISGATITASFGGAPQSFPIAIVGDQDQSAATLVVTAINTTGNGILIGSVTIDATGKVTAIIQVGCGATDSTFQLTVTDALGGMATAQLTVRVARSAVAFPGEQSINWRHSAIGAAAGCQPAGPGLSLAAEAAIGAQKPGSLLIFNIHTSRVGSIREETRTAITNTSPTRPIDIHLFFVDGASGMVADSFLHLTPGQTSSLLASEIDPETTGYLIALAVDEHGCPAAFNHLIGETFVRFESGHAANLGALAVSVIDRAAIVCNPGAVTADIRFDGIVWNELPRVIAVDSLPSRAEGNSTMLILNRLGGSLVDGVPRLGAINGLLYDDVERSVSFTLTESRCQLRGTLGQNFPRTSPRYDSLIPAGRSGWMKLAGEADDTAITGTAIGLGQNRFSQGHNLHLLTTTALVVLTVPVLLP